MKFPIYKDLERIRYELRSDSRSDPLSEDSLGLYCFKVLNFIDLLGDPMVFPLVIPIKFVPGIWDA